MGKKNLRLSFDEYYRLQLGSRWETLKPALLEAAGKYLLKNPFGLADYELDYASVLAARCLGVEAGQDVLDMCAAPGGKSLVMLFSAAARGRWVLNDQSVNRLGRLKRVIRESIPVELQAGIRITHGNAALWGQRNPESYDRILLDAPCSGERHLLHNAAELAKWSPSRGQRLAQQQYALLCSAAQALRAGGLMIYSTCSVNPQENDAVIEKFLNKKTGQLQPLAVAEKCASIEMVADYEQTSYGCQLWPDRSSWGPIYFSLLQKE